MSTLARLAGSDVRAVAGHVDNRFTPGGTMVNFDRITYTRAEIRTGTGFMQGQKFVRLEDAEYALDEALSAILCAAGRWEDTVREAMTDAGYFWVCADCGWYGARDQTECDQCGVARVA